MAKARNPPPSVSHHQHQIGSCPVPRVLSLSKGEQTLTDFDGPSGPRLLSAFSTNAVTSPLVWAPRARCDGAHARPERRRVANGLESRRHAPSFRATPRQSLAAERTGHADPAFLIRISI